MARHAVSAGGARTGTRSAARASRRRRRRGRISVRLTLSTLLLGVGVLGLFQARHFVTGPPIGVPAGASGRETPVPAPPARPSPAPTRSPSAAQPPPSATPAPHASQKADADGFVTARLAAPSVGSGTIRRFMVRVEDGTGMSADGAAREVYDILADPRSWTADGTDGFQLVSAGSRDFVVVIATPATVDRICGAAGLQTRGEVNCAVGSRVVVNLKRWNTGSPNFSGPLQDYRALIINHEVGHRIGHGHEGCPGPGKPAPAMMQQIHGLDGCAPNAWPYDAQGTYLGGPSVP
ncbi:DUF3152 domain-containing protein [Streptomyces shenzhenensis]